MNISNIPFLNNPLITNKASYNKFYLSETSQDTFEKSSNIREAKIQDKDGNEVRAVICEEILENCDNKEPKKFSLYIDGEELGYAHIYNSKKSIYLKELYTQENAKKLYKGIGTALLKSVVNESIKRGYKGQITLNASHNPPPFVFYYKNNFTVCPECDIYNAAIDYATRNDIPITKVLSTEHLFSLNMELDEKGANALLENKRLYKDRESKTLCTARIGQHSYEANIIQSPDKKNHYLQIIDKDAKIIKQNFVGKMDIQTNKSGEKYLLIYNIDDANSDRKIKSFAKHAAKLYAQKSGINNIVFNDYN